MRYETLGLSREDYICLLKGKEPSYKAMDHHLVDSNGSYSGSYGTWDWKYDAFKDNTDDELELIYKILSIQ